MQSFHGAVFGKQFILYSNVLFTKFYFTPWHHCRAFSSSLLHAIISHNHLPFFKIFSNFVHFCWNFRILYSFMPLLTFVYPVLSFSWKILCMSLLSRKGPALPLICAVGLSGIMSSQNSSGSLVTVACFLFGFFGYQDFLSFAKVFQGFEQ